MLTFNEGLPRAGKSYDAVANHLLPALKARRRVFARINGLNYEAIARHCGMTVEEVSDLLTHVPSEDVVRLCVQPENDEEAEAFFPKDCLIIIDEAHLFWKEARKPLPVDQERFFAEHGQFGRDILLISQWFKRLHDAVKGRVARKNVFTKATVLGMGRRYMQRFYECSVPGKFDFVGSTLKKYDRKIFPLYAGYRDGVDETGSYSGGQRTIWRKLAPLGFVFIPLLLWGAWTVAAFFLSPPGAESKHAARPVNEARPAEQRGFAPKGPAVPKAGTVAEPVDTRPAGVQYVWKLTEGARPRLAGTFEGTKRVAIVEWRTASEQVTERLTTSELAELGVRSIWTRYGLKLTHGGQTIIVTHHPTDDAFGRISQAQRARMGGGGGPGASLASRGPPPPRHAPTSSAAGSPRVGQGFGGVEKAMQAGGGP